ncbi:MAG: site-specific DNA-methyltransferase [Clostridia bacterium]
MNIQILKIENLKPAEYNPRKDLTPEDEEYQKIKNSLTEFGYVAPVIVNADMTVIGGHQRLKVLKELGYTEIECNIVDLDKNKEKALNIALNKITGEWDNGKLEELLAELKEADIDMDMTGFSFDEVDNILKDITGSKEDDFDLDEALNEIEEPVSKPGDIWILGKHRLMCGDSTSKDDIEKLMNNHKSDMVFTDPPYLMDFDGNVHADGSKSFNASHGKIKNDNMTREEGDEFILKIFENIRKYNKGAYYVCFYRLGLDYIFRALDKLNNRYKALIIWNKGNHTLSNSDYMSKYEPIVYGWFASHLFYGNRSNFDIWDIERTRKNDLHPTMKPVNLVVQAIKNSSKTEDIILDLFGGSGTTLIAAEQMNRMCYMMELDPRYCDVIIKRWENLTGEKAILEK